ncbi:diphthine methyl ester synthase [Eurytemora carolleeae]|uniref:diphthine methyl ester synthase n=1 Tax=Eurytemora carolleeae TaxID=1294199 RepID=UPI000C77B89C|nr:diphthine methyl ester synthase [Eurytemora carolleeae]|eukprot:XP_023343685.1 diphthine methyl ester synthase-like [Eurytemora affinis]
MLYFIGLGLGDAKDITVRGLEIVKQCDRVYLEHYTSILTCGKEELEILYGREVILADRDMVEQSADTILEGAKESDIAFLVVGDPFGATTHTDLVLRAREQGIPHRVVHNASIMNAIGCTGLQLYNFGETVSIPFWTENWKPDSFYDKIMKNRDSGQHTLCLLDIKVKEQSEENLIKGRKIFEPPRFMSTQQAAQQLLEIVVNKEQERGTGSVHLKPDSKVVCVARVGTETQKLLTCSLLTASQTDLGPPLHSLVIPGVLHDLEADALEMWKS